MPIPKPRSFDAVMRLAFVVMIVVTVVVWSVTGPSTGFLVIFGVVGLVSFIVAYAFRWWVATALYFAALSLLLWEVWLWQVVHEPNWLKIGLIALSTLVMFAIGKGVGDKLSAKNRPTPTP